MKDFKLSKTIIFLQFIILIESSPNLIPGSVSDTTSQEHLVTQAWTKLDSYVDEIAAREIKNLEIINLEPIKNSWENLPYTWSNITLEGLQNANIRNISINSPFKVLLITFETNLILRTNWEADGHLLSAVHLQGAGIGEVSLKNLHMEMMMPFEITKNEQNKDIMQLKRHYYGYDVDSVRFNFRNVFRNDKDSKRSELLHDFVNSNWRILYNVFSKVVNDQFTQKIFVALHDSFLLHPIEGGLY